ncbi:hypothetical protein FQA39_LY03592 [Lamprigera yunnana]|nr:hypothetical protein FQA39_LY03592 [Lamprigera yunnana]
MTHLTRIQKLRMIMHSNIKRLTKKEATAHAAKSPGIGNLDISCQSEKIKHNYSTVGPEDLQCVNAFVLAIFCFPYYYVLELHNILEYYIRLGYTLSQRGLMNGPTLHTDEFAINLYKWAIKNRSVPSTLQGRGMICFPNGHCVQMGDPGVHP